LIDVTHLPKVKRLNFQPFPYAAQMLQAIRWGTNNHRPPQMAADGRALTEEKDVRSPTTEVIRSVEELRTLSRGPSLLRFLQQVPNTRFELPELSDDRNRDATTRLSNYRDACGCFAGGLVMGLAVIGFFTAFAMSGRGISDVRLSDLLVFLSLFIVSTLAGKAIGVLWARIRAIQLIRRLATQAA
jgi:hypothetical protein